MELRSRAFSFSPAALRPVDGVLLLALAVVAIPRAHSQEIDLAPLAPPDTSSPRATLKSFRKNMEQAFRAFYEEREFHLPDAGAERIRAVACLNTSQLPPIRVERLATEAALILNDVLGTVESIGLRSTRTRRWGGNLLSVPNSRFVEHQLDNYSDARYIWIRQRLRLRYETSPEQLSYILAKIREMLFAHPKIVSPRVRLIGFGDDALTVEVICNSDTGVWAEWHAISEDVFLRILQIIEASGTRLALPSKTNYFTRDDSLDEERRRAAEQRVRKWAKAGELPVPDMSEEQRKALAGTLHFPPEGSVEHKAGSEKD